MNVCYSLLGSYGRLGNQLWEIAATLGVAARLGADVQFNRWDYEPYFRVPDTLFVDEPDGIEAWHYASNLPPSEQPYMQDFNLLIPVRHSIRDYFQPSDVVKEQLAKEYGWFYEIEDKVAIHIRRDERLTQFADTHPTPPRAYYERAMKLEQEWHPNATFCVFSDDIEWCRSYFSNSNVIFVEGYPRYQDSYLTPNEPQWKDYLDMFLMTDCVGHVIPNSTFSWWGAYLSDNPRPIYPAVWYGGCLEHLDWRLQIPSGWEEVDWR